ncbi:pinin/SDK/memA/ protein conserved region-domain-containing protein [Penicillium pulvis]|uniref:pinin/SDK/memA/ protein conserved region-domain-containing protein n=1 Tax=Penicillium pulvis TaxID=1562058 RepID=UPI0025482DAB|nr:pinin/SDK/memA/ protein conserved region-domain-containing protein [Penicillium pulvis]KAJ5785381.1 pinin/SDK/memA/ protein conserved region-domain-containing protein [Penicillium pulvis]
MRKRYRSPASAVGRPRHDHTRPSLYPDLYPARGRRNSFLSEHAAKRHRFSPKRADCRSSPRYHYPTEEYHNSSPAENVLKRRQSSQGSVHTHPLSEYQYPERGRHNSSPSEYAVSHRQFGQGSANIHPSIEYQYPAEEHRNSSPSEYTAKHRRFIQGKAATHPSSEYDYQAEEYRHSSPSEYTAKHRRFSQENADIHPSPEYHYPVEERRRPTASDQAVKRRKFRQGSDVFFPNQPHPSDASWRGPPPSEETRPEKPTSGEERQRGQRLFSNLTNALSRKQTDIAQKTREGRREQIELRQQAKLKADTFLWESNRQRKRRTERHEMAEDMAKAFRERDAMMARHAKNLVDARYLKTVTEPVLLWRPAKLRDGDEETIRDQIEYAERTNAAEYAEFMKKYPAQTFDNVEFEAGMMNGDIQPPKEEPESVVDTGTTSVPKTESKFHIEESTADIFGSKEMQEKDSCDTMTRETRFGVESVGCLK